MSTVANLDLGVAPSPPGYGIVKICRPLLSALVIVGVDFLVLAGVLWMSAEIDASLSRHSIPANLLHFWPVPLSLVLIYWISDAHPGVGVCQAEEFKRTTIVSVVVTLCLLAGLQIYGAPLHTSLAVLSSSVVITMAIPVSRYLTRLFGARFAWWGQPVAILGDGEAALSVLRRLQLHPEMGMRPAAVVSLHPPASRIGGQPVYPLSQLHNVRRSGIRHAVIAAPELSRAEFAEILERGRDSFPHIVVIPGLDYFWNTGPQALDFHGMAGLSVWNKLLLPRARFAKRVIDLTFCLLMASFCIPLITLISVLVFLDSGRPIFFSQRRLGRHGKTFLIWKFRTMVRNAEQLKHSQLLQDPGVRKEWTETQKLQNDPRITRVGRVLRKTSLDELPQLWNILKGEMSLVGPRPIIHEEVTKYKSAYTLYVRATPGLTGLWQVSGRNRTTYEERVACDTFYVRNWSVWLDVCVLVKTVMVIITGDGAF